MAQPYYSVPVEIEEDKEDGVYRATSRVLPELITEGVTVDEALENARDALLAVFEIYEELGRPLPESIRRQNANGSVQTELLAPAV